MREYEATIWVTERFTTVQKCKAQHLTWLEIIGCVLVVLLGSINL